MTVITTRITILRGTGRRHIVVYKRAGEWCLAWAEPTQNGYRYEPVLESGFKTKKAAMARKKEIANGCP